MDDHERLLRLISLVAWREESPDGRIGLRFATQDDERWWTVESKARPDPSDPGQQSLADALESARVALWTLLSYYAGAVDLHRGDPQADPLDAKQLPEFALEAVGQMPDELRAVLGRMVRRSLSLIDKTDEGLLARMWVDDVAATSWRLLLDSRGERFGR